jgi:DNA-binding beta-propeller fold protein YncE
LVGLLNICTLQGAVKSETASQPESAANLDTRVEASPTLPFHGVHFAVRPPRAGWESGMVSSVAISSNGTIYEIQRGPKAAPVLVVDRDGKLLRSWGTGNYKIPHSIRLDPQGNVWTVDASLSTIIKYSRQGEKLMTISIGEQPNTDGPFNGATDIAFAPNGNLFITDGYGNARVLEYTASGKRVKQWGRTGNGPGEFHLPHAIQIGGDGTVYVADRENGRIEKFDLDGRYLGEISDLGRIYSFKLVGDAIWVGVQSFDQPPGSPGWVVKLDSKTGRILGHLDVPEVFGLHSIETSPSGEPVTVLGNQLLWFRRNESPLDDH